MNRLSALILLLAAMSVNCQAQETATVSDFTKIVGKSIETQCNGDSEKHLYCSALMLSIYKHYHSFCAYISDTTGASCENATFEQYNQWVKQQSDELHTRLARPSQEAD